jgi:23S rRNA (cytosine1962-C5)-methyltransferase
MSYQLLDSGEGQKLEKFGDILLIRPSAGALWRPKLSAQQWNMAHGRFSRKNTNQWEDFCWIPQSWEMNLKGIHLKLKRTDFGHLGVFPEHANLWSWMFSFPLKKARILNIFAYSGASTLALASRGAHVTHVDAARGMVQWAKENADLNGLQNAPIRWIVDDARKYLARAERRGERFDAILLDPPSFGRGKIGEVFKIERDLPKLLIQCRNLLSENPLFVLLTCHTQGYTPLALRQLIEEVFHEGLIESGEMAIEGPCLLPSGTFARWKI